MSQIETDEPNKATTEVIPIDDEDLEDGEIDDSDEETAAKDDEDVVIVSTTQANNDDKKTNKKNTNASNNTTTNNIETTTSSIVTVIDSSSDTAPTPPPPLSNNVNLIKSKKPTPIEDDHASSIENAIAMALKKKGIEPTIPKVLESKLQHGDEKDDVPAPGQGQSKSSRRRKRKKEKEKERKEKKKRYDSTDPLGPPPLEDEVDMDEYEMMNVRGGSPPPMAALPTTNTQTNMHMYKDQYDSEDDTGGSSYDSYDSEGDDSNSERRRRKRKKESRKRKEKRQREDDKRHDKRSRRDSMDHRNEPRKLELCKFYLMECCAKKDKCSYMHADFPCKYYYLGMECVQKEECKFSHGKPLSEELRNILLKHLETAPKEILGNFKRLSRENSLAMVTKRHEELCRTFNVQNVWAPCTASSLPIHSNRRNNNMNNKNNNNNNDQQHHNKQQQQQQNTNNSGIPSLLDLVVNPPPNMDTANNKTTGGGGGEQNKRKSRWADNMNTPALNNINNQMSIQPPSKTAPAYLDLKNLHGILSAEHIDKLQQLGVVNLEQVNQLTFGQLNQIGLTIAEITEIQLNAINMAKLGVTTTGGSMAPGNAATVSSSTSQQSPLKTTATTTTKPVDSFANLNKESSSSSNGDVDMRFLPTVSTTTVATSSSASTSAAGPDKDVLTSSNSNSSSGVVMVDYSQYLKDSNISFDRGDMYDDEKDEEQLVIDDDNTDNEEHHKSTESLVQDTQEKKLPSDSSYDNGFAAQLPAMTGLTQTFRNPFKTDTNLYDAERTNSRDDKHATDKLLGGPRDRSPEDERDQDVMGGFYSSSARRRYSRESRSRSRTPTRSQSNTPEASQSPQPLASLGAEECQIKDVVYERSTMYDFSSRFAEEDEQRALKTKMDKDMRFLPAGLGADASASDIDLRLPFQPMTNYTPATEIDGSITSHLPITYKVYEVDVPRPVYVELRQHFKSDHATDPRLRRILGLPELSQSKTSAALSRKVRKTSHSSSIASPSESEEASPKYYTPPANREVEEKPKSRADPRGDPRAAAAAETRTDPRSETRTETRTDPRSDPRRQDPRSAATANASNSNSIASGSSNAAGGQKQNVEIRNLLQKSEWYKNLNSKFKIMVNQQLALVSTELKKFHQDPSPNKIFDISFIVNNQTLQQILTNLGIYIDDNGEVAHIDNDNEELMDSGSDMMGAGNLKSNINLPNMSQPPPNVGPGGMQQNNPALDFLRAPPPMVVAQGPPPIALGPMFQRPPMQVQGFARPSLLGMAPAGQGNPLNPFANPLNINPNFLANPNLLGGPFGPNFGPNMGMGPNMQQQQQQRNFNNNQRNNQRNNRRKI
ncbi:protein suppressor of sable [Lucilia cuprina]|uniref:protein suppressor of sable n=1 Tax=Lucilia cuprina TaxID=7375 RepID=UPI001F05CC85|nr:protein suppressor of sable [Lucilia cuprina]